MDKMDEALDSFIAALKGTDIYHEYRRTLEEVKKDPSLKLRVDDFRKRNHEMQMSEDLDFAKLSAFQEEFKTLSENPLVDSFLAAELDFCRMMQNINFSIVESVDFE